MHKIYNLLYWRLGVEREAIVGRPTWQSALQRLGITCIAGLVLFGLNASFPHVRVLAPHAEYLDQLLVVVCALLAAIGLLAPLSVLWQRIRIQNDLRRALEISTLLFLPRRLVIPRDSIHSMPVVLTEERVRGKRSCQYLGWRWRVLLETATGSAEFWIDQSKDRPALGSMPSNVKTLVTALERMTGVQSLEPQVSEWKGYRRTSHRTGQTHTTHSQPTVQHRTFHSLEEAPPELRPRLEAMMNDAVQHGASSVREERITVRDSDGNEKTYNSLDEMPPELRARLKSMRDNPGR